MYEHYMIKNAWRLFTGSDRSQDMYEYYLRRLSHAQITSLLSFWRNAGVWQWGSLFCVFSTTIV